MLETRLPLSDREQNPLLFLEVPAHWKGGRPPSVQKRYSDILRSANRRSSRRKRERKTLQTRSLPTSNSSQDSGFHGVVVAKPQRAAPARTERRVKAKRVLVYLNGEAVRRHVVKLDRRTATFDQVMEDLSVIFQKSLRKMFDDRGVPVSGAVDPPSSTSFTSSPFASGGFRGADHQRRRHLCGQLRRGLQAAQRQRTPPPRASTTPATTAARAHERGRPGSESIE